MFAPVVRDGRLLRQTALLTSSRWTVQPLSQARARARRVSESIHHDATPEAIAQRQATFDTQLDADAHTDKPALVGAVLLTGTIRQRIRMHEGERAARDD